MKFSNQKKLIAINFQKIIFLLIKKLNQFFNKTYKIFFINKMQNMKNEKETENYLTTSKNNELNTRSNTSPLIIKPQSNGNKNILSL